ADVRVTRQPRKRRAAKTLRIRFITECCQSRDLLVEHKNRRLAGRLKAFYPGSSVALNQCSIALILESDKSVILTIREVRSRRIAARFTGRKLPLRQSQ